jgi:hypothetical protein
VFKRALCELLEAELVPLQQKVKEIKESKSYFRILQDGAEEASRLAAEKMTKVYKAIGIY